MRRPNRRKRHPVITGLRSILGNEDRVAPVRTLGIHRAESEADGEGGRNSLADLNAAEVSYCLQRQDGDHATRLERKRHSGKRRVHYLGNFPQLLVQQRFVCPRFPSGILSGLQNLSLKSALRKIESFFLYLVFCTVKTVVCLQISKQ